MGLLLRGATVIDGSGAPGQPLEVLVEGARIHSVGDHLDRDAHRVVDLDGLVLCPGFIDLHTHYDAQVLWDRDLTPSCWHGVTTVVMGNCGFGVAPTSPSDRPTIIATLENVEGMSAHALATGMGADWGFQTFTEYLDAVARRGTRLNVGAFLGHTSLRLFVMGEESMQRPATAAELARMTELVAGAMAAGAMGFSTSHHVGHVGAGGRPVPSRLAEWAEIEALGAAMGASGKGIMQLTMGGNAPIEQLIALAEHIGRPVTLAALVTGTMAPGRTLEVADQVAAASGQLWPQISPRPITMQVTLEAPYILARVPAFAEALAADRTEKLRMYRDPAWRDRARAGTSEWAGSWDKAFIEETTVHDRHRGRTIGEVARERQADPFDTLVDLALEDELATRVRFVRLNDDTTEIAQLLQKPHTVIGLSDAGAHGDSLCDAGYSTELLSRWVRDVQALSLEQAVWRLSGQPAQLLELRDRGLVRPGYVADLVAFDPESVGPGELERVWDLPGAADRLVTRGQGVEHVWVGGEETLRGGQLLEDVYPGQLIRS